ncbi:MAG: hypothetical protein HC846_04620 [Blastocatellia bacterium]|nr:hypothetical protein [Blastocatellia bacterium]
MAIANEEIFKLKQSIKLSEVMRSRGVELKRKGKQMFGLCPFHAEETPSLAVDDGKGLWNCLGKCGVGGDVFSFIQKIDSCSFQAAFALLTENGNRKSENKKPKYKARKPTAEL